MIADDVAAAVAAELDRGPWAEGFTPRRVETVVPLAPDDFDLRVLVLDFGVLAGRAARRVLREDVVLDVAVQQRLEEDTERVRALKDLCQDILRHFAFAWVGYPLLSAEYLAYRVPEHLREDRVFTGIVRLTYRNHHHA